MNLNNGKIAVNRLLNISLDKFEFLKKQNSKYDFIFADPPYELANMTEIHDLVFKNQLLNEGGILIIEHGAKTKLDTLEKFTQQRKYGNVNFSFFENK